MNKAEIIQRISGQAEAIRAEGVEHLGIFGSRARGDERAGSDLDVLIDVRPGVAFSLFNLSSVALLIEGVTGISVQVVLRRSVPDDFKRRIVDDLAPVF